MKIVFNILKKFVVAGFTIFVFNLMVSPLNFVLPINFISIIFTMIFGLLALPFFSILIMFFF